MSRIAASVVFVLVFSVASNGRGEGMPDEVRKHINDHMIGTFEFTTKFDGETWKQNNTTRWSPAKNVAISEGTTTDEKGSYVISEITGWDDVEKDVVMHGFTSRGDHWTTRYDKREGNTWTGHGTGLWDGKEWKSDVKQVWSDDGFRYEDTTEGKPFVVVGKRVSLKDAEQKLRAFGKFMAGAWTRTDDGVKREHSYRWGLKRNFIRSNGRKDPQAWDGFIGVDLSNNQVGWWGFFADGTSGVVHLTKATDEEWEFLGYDYGPKGEFQRRVVIKKLAANQLHGIIEDTADGKTEVLFDEKWDRKPKPAN